ncbi:MAG: ABC transporter permease subunit [Burkholderiales bacterium]
MSVILRKELALMGRSPALWCVLGILFVLIAWQFIGRIDPWLLLQPELAKLPAAPGVTESVIAPAFNATAWALLLLAPLLAMRLLSEEKRQRTLALLISAPISLRQIVLGKFFSLLVLLGVMVLFSMLLAASLRFGGALDWGLIASNLLGLILFAAFIAAFSLFVSALSLHPLMAAIAALLLLFLLTQLPAFTGDSKWLPLISPLYHFEPFNLGVLDFTACIYFVLLTLVFLLLTVAALDRAKRY